VKNEELCLSGLGREEQKAKVKFGCLQIKQNRNLKNSD
jgi:hypothetical protein